jgi:hypothetical protein
MKDTEKRNSGFECEISRIGKRCDPEDWDSPFLRNIVEHLPDYTALHPRR